MDIQKVLREHRRLSLLKAIKGDDVDKFNYATLRALSAHIPKYAITGSMTVDIDKSSHRAVQIFNRLKRLS